MEVTLLPCLHVACGKCTTTAVETHSNDLICSKCVLSTKQVLLEVNFQIDSPLKALSCDVDACFSEQAPQDAELLGLTCFSPSTVIPSHFGKGLDLFEKCVLSGTDQTCDYCAFEQKHMTAISRCFQCSDNLCSKCAGAHMKTKLTRHHMVVSYAPETDEIIKCNDAAVAFCFQCRRTLCLSCEDRCAHGSRNPHEHHRTAKLDTAVDMVKATISDLLDKLSMMEKDSVLYALKLGICHVKHRWSDLYELTDLPHPWPPCGNSTFASDSLCNLSGLASAMQDEREAIQNAIQTNAQSLHEYIDRVTQQMQANLIQVSENAINSFHQKAFGILLFLGCSESATRLDEILSDSNAVIARLMKLSLHNFPSFTSVIWPRYTLPMVDYSLLSADEVTDPKTANRAALLNTFLGRLDFEEQFTGQTPRASEKVKTVGHVTPEPKPPSPASSSIEDFSFWPRKNIQIPTQVSHPPGPNLEPEPPLDQQLLRVFLAPLPAHRMVEKFQLSDKNSSRLDSEDAETPACDRNSEEPARKLKLQREFQASSPTDSREVWPTGLAVNQRSGEIFILDRDNAQIKVSAPFTA
ncbi:unnamed protein product [Dibothriocephalus latus]|uniref:B box-type domain-containing protein n=1 Tax=Dibothriocephalus latus TaxID=60516 RepID=A0A3P6S1E7_DIBLA|nr:unnamed protein product [Dibothriocephalus latus]